MAAPMKSTFYKNNDVIVGIVKDVTQLLLKGKKPPDDTLIHNLLDSLKQNVTIPEDVYKMEIDVFVEKIIENHETFDESIVSFAINLCGWLLEEDAFYCAFADRIKRLFTSIGYKINSEKSLETVILTSYFDSLTVITKHTQGLTWLLKECQDVISNGLKLLISCPSIFLEKSIIYFICAVIVQSECCSECATIIDVIQLYLDKLLKQNTSRPFVAPALKILETVCVGYPGLQHKLLTNHGNMFNTLFALLSKSDNKNTDSALRIIHAVFKHCCRRHTEDTCIANDLISTTDSTLSDLIAHGNLVMALKLAACGLELDENNSLYEKCCILLCEPLYWIFGEVKGQLMFSEQHLLTSMNKCSTCINIVCLTLNTHTIPIDLIIRILQNTVTPGDISINSYIASHLLNNGKIQRKCLECLLTKMTSLYSDGEAVTLEGCNVSPMCRCVLNLYRNAECESSVSSLCSKVLIVILPQLFSDIDYITLTSELADIIQRHLSALKWELRDSSLELLQNIINTFKDNTSIVGWLEEYRLPHQIWVSLTDNESYVRASALSALLSVTQCDQLYNHLKQTTSLSEDDIIRNISQVIQTDTEAFARRSAMTFLCEYYKVKVTESDKCHVETIPSCVIATVVKALRDFDWEVKNIALDFVIMLFSSSTVGQSNREHESYSVTNISNCSPGSCKVDLTYIEDSRLSFLLDVLCQQKLGPVLIEILGDYDDTVCEKSLNVFSLVQSYLTDARNCLDRSSFHNVLQKYYKQSKCCSISEPTSDSNRTTDGDNTHCVRGIPDEQFILKTVNEIIDLDLDVYKSRLNYSHDKVAKLVSLAEDIVSYMPNEDDEKISDCY